MGQAPELPDMPLPRCQAHLTGFLAYKSNLGAQRTVCYKLATKKRTAAQSLHKPARLSLHLCAPSARAASCVGGVVTCVGVGPTSMFNLIYSRTSLCSNAPLMAMTFGHMGQGSALTADR